MCFTHSCLKLECSIASWTSATPYSGRAPWLDDRCFTIIMQSYESTHVCTLWSLNKCTLTGFLGPPVSSYFIVSTKRVLVDVQYCSVFVFYIMVLCLNWQHTCINLVFCILDIWLKTCHYCIHIGFFIANTSAP